MSYSSSSGQFTVESGDAAVCFVTEALTVDFTATPTWREPPHRVDFHATVAGELDETVTCLWDSGDGNTSTQGPDIDHEYTVAGAYTVTLTGSTPTRSATEAKLNLIVASHNLPAVKFGAVCILLLALAYAGWQLHPRDAREDTRLGSS